MAKGIKVKVVWTDEVEAPLAAELEAELKEALAKELRWFKGKKKAKPQA